MTDDVEDITGLDSLKDCQEERRRQVNYEINQGKWGWWEAFFLGISLGMAIGWCCALLLL